MRRYYKLAGLTVAVRTLYPETHRLWAAYRTDEETAAFAVETRPSDLDLEAAQIAREAERDGTPVPCCSPGKLEQTAVYRKIAEGMLAYDRLVFHGSCVAVDGRGYLFAARSGTGKSTHAALWEELLGARAEIVNDDKPILHIRADGVTAYGTPYNGKHRRGRNMAAPLSAVCLLERAAENRIAPIPREQAYPLLVQQAYRPRNALLLERTMRLIDRLSRCVRLYRLGCTPELSAAEAAWNAMGGEEDETEQRFSGP